MKPTLRDEIAMRALPALIERHERWCEQELLSDDQEFPANTSAGWDETDTWDAVSAAAYAIADSMLKARKTKEIP